MPGTVQAINSLGTGGTETLDRNISALAPLAFTASDRALQASQAIAVLAASDYISDSFTAADGTNYNRVYYEGTDDANPGTLFSATISHVGESQPKLETTAEGVVKINDRPVDAMIYKATGSNKYFIQADGKLIAFTIDSPGFDGVYDINAPDYAAFAAENNITVNTKLGATILLKTLLMDEGYPSEELDSTFLDIQPDYIAFIEKTLTPGLDSELTAVSSGIKAAIDFLKKIIQKASQ